MLSFFIFRSVEIAKQKNKILNDLLVNSVILIAVFLASCKSSITQVLETKNITLH